MKYAKTLSDEMRFAGIFLILAVLVSIVFATLSPSSARAALSDNSRLDYGNAGSYCSGKTGVSGMVWLSNQTDYYSETVAVSATTTTANVSVRGAANTCDYAYSAVGYDNQVWAINVNSAGSSAWRLSIDGSAFYRGSVPRATTYAWTSQGNRLPATLDVSGVAPCSAASAGVSSGSLVVGVYRRLQHRQMHPTNPDMYTTGGDGTEYVTVNVERSCPPNYSLTPTVSGVPGYAEAGTAVSHDATVTNSGSTESADAEWRLSRIFIAPGDSRPTAQNSASDPAGFLTPFNTSSVGSLQDVASGSQTFPGNNSPTSVNAESYVLPDAEPGTQICLVLSVNPRSHSAGTTPWRHGEPACVVIAKAPKIQVLGGDAIIGGDVTTSTSPKTVSGQSRTFGSWGEYAVIAGGLITGMASGAGYSENGYVDLNNICDVAFLTVTNANGSGACQPALLGNYGVGAVLPALAEHFAQTTGSLSGSTTLSGVSEGVYSASGTLDVTGGGTISGKYIVINAPGATVNVTGDIVLANGPYNSIQDVPQVVIIANNINISSGVQRIDAWLIASGVSGVISTCAGTAATDLRSNVCSNPLEVNGPVAAREIDLYRTHGSETGLDSDIPAEVFNLRADAYLWATNFNNSKRLQTVSIDELPPRF